MRITIEGPTMSGKSVIAQFILEKLREIGVEGRLINPEHGLRAPEVQANILQTFRGSTIKLVEKHVSCIST